MQTNMYRPKIVRLNRGDHDYIHQCVRKNLGRCLVDTRFNYVGKQIPKGKVRDMYETYTGDKIVFVTTDRQSAFDRVVAEVPFKGQVLNQTSEWWFEQTDDIIENAVLSVPDPRVCIMKNLEPVMVEFVVRGYMTGSTHTSLWTYYKKGHRDYCGVRLPDGLTQHQKLPENVVTPTTKGGSDIPVSKEEIVNLGLLTASEYDHLEKVSLALFERGQEESARRGLMLVDTKYEFGRGHDGRFYLIDEIHTPDSSRYWIKDTYASNLEHGLEPEHVDKEILRLWFKQNHPAVYKSVSLPKPPDHLVCELSMRYIYLYETITGKEFVPHEYQGAVELEYTILDTLY